MSDHARPLPYRLIRVLWERFPPYSHGIYAIILAGATWSIDQSGSWFSLMLAAGETILVLVALRLFDDAKDADVDRTEHPGRPIPRGVMSEHEAVAVACIALAGSIVLGFAASTAAGIVMVVVAAYAGLMSRGFFAKQWVESRIVLFVLSHTAIAVPLMICVALTVSGSDGVAPGFLLLAGIAWSGSAAYDFSRKLMLPNERGYARSYSATLGMQNTTIATLVCVVAVMIGALIIGVVQQFSRIYQIVAAAAHLGALVSGIVVLVSGSGVRLFRSLASGANIVPFIIIIAATL